MNYTKSYIKDYPRPSLVRNSFLLLNGIWDFRFDEKDSGLKSNWSHGFVKEYDIKVPFSYLTIKSQVNIQKRVDVIWYQRIYKKSSNLNHILHLEGSDDYTMIWINGIYIGDHEGGYDRISYDISHALNQDDNLIVIRVQDDFRTDKPRGKQRWKPENFGCWYHETTGIWKTVWMEFVDSFHIKNIQFMANLDQRLLTVDYELNQLKNDLSIEIYVEFNHQEVSYIEQKITRLKDKITFSIQTEEDQFKIKTWSSNHPNLYDVKIIIKDKEKVYDQVLSYFGVTKWRSIQKGIYLNDQPTYLKMLLDQGYWPESGLTPNSEEDIIKDILLTKEMGFNGIRKHQKIEDDRFYYFCDLLGLYVWLEMPSAYEFNQVMMNRITHEWLNILNSHLNFPSIMTYVLFNESWGVPSIINSKDQQDFTVGLYYLTKSIDQSRFIISNDGWEHTLSDLVTIHNYLPYKVDLENAYREMDKIVNNEYVKEAKARLVFAEGFKYQNQPIIISEYGGIAFETKSGWGYGDLVKTDEEFINRLSGLTEAIKEMKDVSGYCLTQTTDVEQEVNGLLDPYRNPKIEIQIIQKMNKK
jgi:hypothetical protein